MRHRKSKITLDRNSAQRRRLLKNLAISMIIHERITTTPARAKATRSMVEKLITTGKENTLHRRRLLIKAISQEPAVKKVLEVLGPRYAKRAGGYIRAMKLQPRQGDGAEQVVLEFVE